MQKVKTFNEQDDYAKKALEEKIWAKLYLEVISRVGAAGGTGAPQWVLNDGCISYDPNQVKKGPVSFFSWKSLENQQVQFGFSENWRVQLYPLHLL